MDTKLKKGKKIRTVLYRAIMSGFIFAALFCAISGYKALMEVADGNYQAITGDVIHLKAFQQYIGKVYNDGMMAFAGVGDDNGYPLEDNGTDSIKETATLNFYDAIGENQEDLFYYVYDNNFKEEQGEYGNEMHTNFPYPIFSEFDGHLILPDDVVLLFYQNGTTHSLTSDSALGREYIQFSYMPNAAKAEDLQFVLAMKKSAFLAGGGTIQKLSHIAVDYSKKLICLSVSLLFIMLFGLMGLFSSRTLRQVKKDMAQIPSRILMEIKVLALIVIAVLLYKIIGDPFIFSKWKFIGVFLCGFCFYPIFLDLKVYIENGQIMANSISAFVSHNVQEWAQGKTWRQKLGLYAGLSMVGADISYFITFILACNMRMNEVKTKEEGLVTAIILFATLGVVLLGIGIYYLVCFIREVEVVADKISGIRQGNLNNPIDKDKQKFLVETAADLNELENGMETAVEQKSRSDKMRVELITNVSHDLKTPLTSIINYVDLLCEEELPPAAQDYAKALKEKSYKLKAMVQDVFEISKASSGNLPVEKTVLDVGKLIRQTLADMDERISTSNLTFKVVIPDEPVYIEGDGEKLYRVFQNLFVNAIQYSLDYSRVHVILGVDGLKAVASVKNTSKGELGFDTGEIVERFVRADASRTTEGSGLGLSIVKSFTEACGGEFSIITDADMFTAVLTFPIVKKEV